MMQTELAPRHKSGLLLKNPVLTAAGTFGYGVEVTKLAEVARLGAIITAGTTLHSHTTHAQPGILETRAGLLYALDRSNPGGKAVIKKYAPTWAAWQTPVLVNIGGESVEDVAELAERLEGVEGVSGIELNSRSVLLAEIVAAVRYATTLPLIVKLWVRDGESAISGALAALGAGADAISLSLDLRGMRVDVQRRQLQLESARLAGPSLKPLALKLTYELAQELRTRQVEVPLIAAGGIVETNDALEFLMAGATAIQVGSISLSNPRAAVEIVEGLERFMQQEGLTDIKEIIGAALS